MNIVRKIKLTIVNENLEERKSQYKFIRDSIYAQYQGLNRGMGYLMSGYYANNMDFKCEEFKIHKNSLTNSLYIFNDITFGKGIDSKSFIAQKVKSDFGTSLKNGLAKGERSAINYKRTCPLMTRGRDLKFKYDDNKLDILINWVNKIQFKCLLGKHNDINALELQHTLHKVITKEYKVCDSSLGFNKRNELILNLNLSIEEKKCEIVKDRTLGVDVGMAIPAYVSISDSPFIRQGLGCYDEFAKVRQQFKDRRRRLQRQLVLVKGGQGRKKKLHSMEYLAEKEKDFAKTYNHMLSKRIVDIAIKNKCEYINIEKINSEGLDDRLLGNWGYYQLQEQIKYKAELVGITVRKVEAKYTSQACSKCGYVDKENRQTQARFECKKCGLKINADWNASINIARSSNFVK